MKISTITNCILQEPYQADILTQEFDNTLNIPYAKDLQLSSGDTVYQFSDYVPQALDWDVSQEPVYVDGQIVFKDGKVTRISKTTSEWMLGAPSLNPDTASYLDGIATDISNPPYIEAVNAPITDFEAFNGFEDGLIGARANSTILERSTSSETGWFSYTKYYIYELVYEAYRYVSGQYQITNPQGSKTYAVAIYNGVTINLYDPDNPSVAPSMVYGTTLVSGTGDYYKVGAQQAKPKPDPEPWIQTYEIAKASTVAVLVSSPKRSCVVTVGRTTTPPTSAEYIGLNNFDDKVYRPTYFNLDVLNNILYSIPKTALPSDYSENSDISYSVVQNDQAYYLPNTVVYSLINPLKPFDDKAYTSLVNQNSFTMSVEFDKADTLALNGIRCDSIDVIVRDSGGVQVGSTISKQVVNTIAIANSDLVDYKTTEIVYFSETVIDGTVEITLNGTENIQLGGVQTGLYIDAGFTNLSFSNRIMDYSPYEKDQWGNIVYIDGVRTNVFKGTADIKLSDYDRINRLFGYLGGKKVIINGSDGIGNEPSDNIKFFSSTKIVGRIRNFALASKLDNKRLSQTATYNFEVEEDI